jgi:L-rhamnose mutarotase
MTVDAPSDAFVAFSMQLRPGREAEYKRRHDAIWPELVEALRAAGVRDYSIFLDEKSLTLFAVLRAVPQQQRDKLAQNPVMRRWWDYMADLMVVQADNRPVETPLKCVFSLE